MTIESNNPKTVYDCCFCGQGPIYLVEIIPQKLGRFLICGECERMWKEGDPMDEEHAIDHGLFMREHNETNAWSNFHILDRLS